MQRKEKLNGQSPDYIIQIEDWSNLWSRIMTKKEKKMAQKRRKGYLVILPKWGIS